MAGTTRRVRRSSPLESETYSPEIGMRLRVNRCMIASSEAFVPAIAGDLQVMEACAPSVPRHGRREWKAACCFARWQFPDSDLARPQCENKASSNSFVAGDSFITRIQCKRCGNHISIDHASGRRALFEIHRPESVPQTARFGQYLRLVVAWFEQGLQNTPRLHAGSGRGHDAPVERV